LLNNRRGRKRNVGKEPKGTVGALVWAVPTAGRTDSVDLVDSMEKKQLHPGTRVRSSPCRVLAPAPLSVQILQSLNSLVDNEYSEGI
jgi:hypothetical protein